MNLREIGWGGVDWIGLAQDRDRWRDLANSVINLRVVGKFLSSCTTVGFSRKAKLQVVICIQTGSLTVQTYANLMDHSERQTHMIELDV
jgi:hypothetical protein